MKFIQIIKLNEPHKTEAYLAQSMSTLADLREAKKAGIYDSLVQQASYFKAKGIKNIVLNAA